MHGLVKMRPFACIQGTVTNSSRKELDHRNLLKMTAMMRRTRMVMMAMVITRFVAILQTC